MVERQKRARGQGGFTLIEIIAVLVILGILAIVAVPKYFDMQDQARKKAAAGLVAAAQSQLSMGYANSKLNSSWNFVPTGECKNVAIGTAGETASVTCEGEAADATVNITATVKDQTANGTWNNPEKSGS